MKDGKICVGIIGLGYIGKLHTEAFMRYPQEVIVLTAADANAETRSAFQQKFDVPLIYEDYRDLLKVEELDARSKNAISNNRGLASDQPPRRNLYPGRCRTCFSVGGKDIRPKATSEASQMDDRPGLFEI